MVDLAVNHRREAGRRIVANVLPDVEDRPTGRIDQSASSLVEVGQVLDGDAKRWENDNVGRFNLVDRAPRIAEKADAGLAQTAIDLWVVDDLTREKYSSVRKPLPSLIGVVDGAVHAIAKPEFLGEVDHQSIPCPPKSGRLDLIDELAVVVLGERSGHDVLEVQTFAEDGS
jgi:hypothetical protein